MTFNIGSMLDPGLQGQTRMISIVSHLEAVALLDLQVRRENDVRLIEQLAPHSVQISGHCSIA